MDRKTSKKSIATSSQHSHSTALRMTQKRNDEESGQKEGNHMIDYQSSASSRVPKNNDNEAELIVESQHHVQSEAQLKDLSPLGTDKSSKSKNQIMSENHLAEAQMFEEVNTGQEAQ